MPSVTERELCVQAFCRDVFLLGWWMCAQWVILRVFRCGHSKYILVSEQNDAIINVRMFLSNCFEWLSLAWKFASLISQSLRFFSKNISQGSVAARLRCGGMFNYYVARKIKKFTAKSVSERIFGRPFVKRFAICYRYVVCLSCRSVCLSCLW